MESLKPVLEELESHPGFNSHGPYAAGPVGSNNSQNINEPRKRPREELVLRQYSPGEHPALFGLNLCDMTYEEYLEQYRLVCNIMS